MGVSQRVHQIAFPQVADVMTRDVITAKPDTPLGDIAAMLERNRIKRVPIVEGEQTRRHRQSRKYSAGIGERDQKTPFPYDVR